MKSSRQNEFYKNDTKLYVLEKNGDILNYLKICRMNGYDYLDSIIELQNLIDIIAEWYENKYLDKYLYPVQCAVCQHFSYYDDIKRKMSTDKLLRKLSRFQLNLVESSYKARGFRQYSVYDGNKKIGLKSQIFMYINDLGSNSSFMVNADNITGKIEINDDITKYISLDSGITLDDLLKILEEKKIEKLDYGELKECVDTHKFEIELRKMILQLVALKLLYSNKSTLVNGYERAKIFIEEFSSDLNINLSTDEIDKIFDDYCNTSEFLTCKEKKIKKMIRNNI